VEPVRESIIRSDVVELRRWLVQLARPGAAAISRDRRPSVVSVDHPLRVQRIDPEPVIIPVRRTYRVETLASVDRPVSPSIQDVHHVWILRIGEHVRVIPRALPV